MANFSVEESKKRKEFFVHATGDGVFSPAGFDRWDSVLGMTANDFVRSWLGEGLISHIDATGLLEKRYKVEELRQFCRDLGIKVSGKKSEITNRLAELAPAWAKSQVEAGEFFQLTPIGKALYQRFSAEIGEESGVLEARISELIYERRFSDAFAAWAAWDSSNAFPSCADDYPGHRPYTAEDFELLAQEVTAVLDKSVSRRFLVDVLMDRRRLFDKSERGAINRGFYWRNLDGGVMDHPDFAGVRFIVSPNHRCTFAERYAGCYLPSDIPDLPPGPCDNEPNCFCFSETLWTDEVTGVEWKTPLRRHHLHKAEVQQIDIDGTGVVRRRSDRK